MLPVEDKPTDAWHNFMQTSHCPEIDTRWTHDQ